MTKENIKINPADASTRSSDKTKQKVLVFTDDTGAEEWVTWRMNVDEPTSSFGLTVLLAPLDSVFPCRTLGEIITSFERLNNVAKKNVEAAVSELAETQSSVRIDWFFVSPR